MNEITQAIEIDKLLSYYYTHSELIRLIGNSNIKQFIKKHKIRHITYGGIKLYLKTEVIHNIK